MRSVIGVDVGTGSTKGVRVGFDGVILATAVREHHVDHPQPGWAEMDPMVWWDEFLSIAAELADPDVAAIGVSGMGPCVALTDAAGVPLRPAILYGVDTRATAQIATLEAQLGAEAILATCGSALSTQAAGPKVAWVAEHEPEVFASARRIFMPASWLAWNLTGSYVLDHHSASQCTPLYDSGGLRWHDTWAAPIMGEIVLPELVWADTVVGTVTAEAAAASGLPIGIPVVAGTIDAWTEAISVDAQRPGDLMLMYGTTMFLVCTVTEPIAAPPLWGTIGAFENTRSLAGGMSTSGAITTWMRDLFGAPDYDELLDEAAKSPIGARGLLLLPYFAGERTPISDPLARGVLAGLTVEHTRGDLYRSALEATAMGVRHNVDALRSAGCRIDRVVAVGGGTRSDLWMRIVSDVTGLTQIVPRVTVGAAYGAAYLAATAIASADITQWNSPAREIAPSARNAPAYNTLFGLYRELYDATASIQHRLALTSSF